MIYKNIHVKIRLYIGSLLTLDTHTPVVKTQTCSGVIMCSSHVIISEQVSIYQRRSWDAVEISRMSLSVTLEIRIFYHM